MVRNLKSGALLLFIFISSVNSFGQKKPDQLDVITEKFTRYCDLFPREEIYVHTDRQEYISGEVLWFGVYLFDRRNSTTAPESRIAYIEILNKENRPVVQKRIKLADGFGPGQIVLPDTLSSGSYVLRAYTNWMKNFLPLTCFIKRLNIYNSLSGKNFIADSEVTANSRKSAGIRGALNQSGSGLKSAFDYKDSLNLILAFNPDQDFLLREGSNYYLFIQTHGKINLSQPVSLSEEGTMITIPRKLLISGLNHFTLFNSSGKPVKEFYTYTPDKQAGMLKLTVPDAAKIREKISLNIEMRNLKVIAGTSTSLSISVAPAGGPCFPGIDEYMTFGSEFGTFPIDILCSDPDALTTGLADDFLSSLKSNWIDWDVILSGKYPEVKYRKESESHFIYGQLINRKPNIGMDGKYLFMSIPGKNAFFRYARTDNNGDFYFTIPIDEKISDIIIQPEEVEGNNIKMGSSFAEKYPELNNSSAMSAKPVSDKAVKLGINFQIMKIYGSENLPEKSKSIQTVVNSKRFYGKPDIELVMDNYIKLPVMQEVFFELIPGVFLRKKKTGYEVSIADPVENKVFNKPPVLFVDGVVINDPDLIANLDPELVEKIDAVKSRYFVGDYMFYGLVNVITRKGDFSSVTLPEYAVRLPYRVSESVRSFSAPDYSLPENRKSRIPDFRNTLYWNPSAKPDEGGSVHMEFWSSDVRSEYIISIQGISADGSLVSITRPVSIR